jgi:hypothetical protein
MPTRKTPLARTLLSVRSQVSGRTPDINSDWVVFDPTAKKILSQYLDDDAIDELREACSFAGAMYHHRRANPISFAAERAQLLKVAEVAHQLFGCLDLRSRDSLTLTAIVELGSNAKHGTANTTELRRLLRVLADGCRDRAKRYRGQARRKTPEYQVRWVARVVEPKGIKPSAAPGSRFTRIVRTCFGAMGIHSDPGRAIRSYIEHKDDDPLRD